MAPLRREGISARPTRREVEEGGGTEAEFTALYEAWHPALLEYCKHHVCRLVDAEALAQEAFLRAWKSWSDYAPDRPFWPWLATIARHLCINEGTMVKRRAELLTEGASRIVPTAPTDDEEAQRVVDGHVVHHALRSLPPHYQRLLRLRDMEGWSYEDIARLEGVTVEAVRGSLKRARSRFRSLYRRTAGRFVGGFAYPLLERVRRRAGGASRLVEAAVTPLARISASDTLAAAMALFLGISGATVVAPPAPSPANVVASSAPPAEAPPPVAAQGPVGDAVDRAAPTLDDEAADEDTPGGAEARGMRGQITAFTVSPAYERDGTVYASGTTDECDAAPRCPVVYRSSDHGSTWAKLAAKGRSEGWIMLPPGSGDGRIFSVGRPSVSTMGEVLEVSTDGGRTFSFVAALGGRPAMSPLFSSDDPRMLIGDMLNGLAARPVALQYVDGVGVQPLPLELPPSVTPATFAFSSDYATSGRVLVGGTRMGPFGLRYPTIHACIGASACREVAQLPFMYGPPQVAAAAEGGPVVAWVPFEVYVSDDRGETFRHVRPPGSGPLGIVRAATTTPDGRVLVTIDAGAEERTWLSSDSGETWRELGDGSFRGRTHALAVLPDGRILAARANDELGVLCSTDDGRSWRRAC